jgi:monovalent cation/proton antiporter MnhG/PhaG subunit
MIGIILIFAGSIISVIGAFGLLRFPDIYSRTHAQTVMSVGGTCLLLLGVFIETLPSLYSAKSSRPQQAPTPSRARHTSPE